MLKLRLPFSIAEKLHTTAFLWKVSHGSNVGETRLWLEGLSISVETAGRSYRVVSEHPPEPDRPGAYQGTIWPRCILRLPRGAAIEQQMMLPCGGNAIAVSWRLVDPSDTPAALRVSPISTVAKHLALTAFKVDAETNGGRLTWRPFQFSSKIIADTNGRLTNATSRTQSAMPASFEFDLGRRPGVLILCAEVATGTSLNPLIGGFLAGLIEDREHFAHQERRLAA